MKICPHCNQENPKGRVLCVHCGRNLEKVTKTRTIINSLWGIIGGLILVFFDTDMVLSIGHVIPIPYGLSFIGIGVIVYCIENIINQVMPSSLLWTDISEQSIQTTMDEHHLSKAIIFGLIAGFIPAVFWYKIATLSGYHFGVLAILVGWAIGKFVTIGTRQRQEISVQVTSVILSLSMLILTEYFIIRYFLVQSLEFSRVPVFLPVNTTISLLSEVWKNEPITILFWIMSLGLAFAVPKGLYFSKPYSESYQKEVKQIQ
ncbi:MAG: hypothetical protein IPP66_01810 [Anaerolineales bacterium]|nr:hypothetical protein [Anaerolineales bacterium]